MALGRRAAALFAAALVCAGMTTTGCTGHRPVSAASGQHRLAAVTGAGGGVPSAAPDAQPGTPPGVTSPTTVPGSAVPGSTVAGVRPPVVRNGPRTGDAVALTFDADMTDAMLRKLDSGAPISYANLAVLDILQRRQVPATFFLTGEWVERYPDVTRRIAADPRFELANHSYRHQGFTPGCYHLGQVPPDAMTQDVARTFGIIAPYGGRQTRYFRFPGLCHDDAALDALAPLGVTVVDGDVVSGDPFATSAAPVIRAVLDRVHPGSIVIMHLTEANARYTDEALGPVLDGLAARGLRPVTLSELLSGHGA